MSDRDAPPSRLRLTAYAAAQLILAVPALALLVLLLIGGLLAVVGVGVPLLLVLVPACRWIANWHRAVAGRVLGTPIPVQYRPSQPGGVVQRVGGWAGDPMTWRDLAWLVFACTAGAAVAVIILLLFLLVVTWALWWFGVPPVMRARAAADRWLLSYGHTEALEQRVQVLSEARAVAVDDSAAELRRLERDLHDGAQARLVALSMTLGVADTLLDTDPEQGRRLVREARSSSTTALGEIRSVLRGIHPPVLADRGLAGAVEALALDMAIPVRVDNRLAGRPPAPVEAATYFAVAECLANVGKHAAADHAWIELGHEGRVLRVLVGDDGRGGADPAAGTGMQGVVRRLGALDGTMSVSSPAGGPTLVRLEVPCDLSSPRTTPSSAPG